MKNIKINRKIITIALIVISIIAVVAGATYAFLRWQSSSSEDTAVSFTVTPGTSCSADGGGDITSSDVMLAPTECTDTNYAIKRTVNVTVGGTDDEIINLSMWLNIII